MHPKRLPSHDAGRVSLLTVAILAGLAGAVYYVAVFGPLYVDNYELRRVMDETLSTAWKNPDDEELRKMVLEKAKKIGIHEQVVDGQKQYLPSIVLLADQVAIDRNKDRNEITMQITYDREVILPLLGRKRTVHFNPFRSADLAPSKLQ